MGQAGLERFGIGRRAGSRYAENVYQAEQRPELIGRPVSLPPRPAKLYATSEVQRSIIADQMVKRGPARLA